MQRLVEMMSSKKRACAKNMMEIPLAFVYKLLWRLAPFIFRLTRVISRGDYLIAFRPFLASDRSVINPNFEREDVKTVFLPKSGETVVDIGANIGIYTLMSSRKIQPDGRVIAIEPDESNLEVLRKNVLINRCHNVTIVPVALGSSNGEKKFYEGIMPTASSFYPESKRRLYKVRKERIVKTVTLDAVLEKLNIREVEWIKIDAEKADLDILLGSKTILQRSKRVKVIVEASNPRTFEYLRNMGFEVKSAVGLAFKHAN